MKKTVSIIVATCLLGGLFPVVSWARFKVEPRLSLREEYNDNLFLDPNNEESDFITTAIPGVGLLLDSNYLNVDLDYGFEFRFYDKNNDRDETSPGDTQRIRLGTDILPGRDFTVAVVDELSRVAIDERRRVAEENAFVNKTNKNRFLVNPSYRYRITPSFDATLGYGYELIDYESSRGDDSERHSGTIDLAKEFSTRMRVSLGYVAAKHHAQNTNDYERHDVSTTVVFPVTRKLTLEGSFGYAWINFIDDADDIRSHTGSAKVDYQFTGKTRGSLAYIEDFSDSVEDGLVKGRSLTGSLTYERWLSGTLSLVASKDDYQTEDREDRSLGGNLTLSIPLTRKLSLGLRGDYTNYRFLPEKEDVDRYSAGASLSYNFKIAQGTVGYNHRINSSDNEDDDYRNNIAYAQVAFRF